VHGVEHGTDALKSGVLQSEQSGKHVETHEATLLEHLQNTLHRTGHDPTGQWEKKGPMFYFLRSLRAEFFPDHPERPMNEREGG
jgi:hypothetical protein